MPDSRLVSGLFVSKGSPLAYLTSSSTYTEVSAAYVNNTSYDVANSAVMCREFIQAARILLFMRPEQMKQGDVWTMESPQAIQKALDAAIAWLSANDTTTSTAGTGSNRVLMPSLGNWR